jgi:hypothetical protein
MSDLSNYSINGEKWREYVYARYLPTDIEDKFFVIEETYKIEEPRTLYVKRNSEGEVVSHRVVDKDGISHYPEPGWKAIRWFDPETPVSF